MIKKRDFIRNWIVMSKEDKAALVKTFKAERDWDHTKSDLGWTTFLGTLTEFVVGSWMLRHLVVIGINDSGYIYQKGDKAVDIKDTCDLEVWSSSRRKMVQSEIKHTKYCTVDTFGTLNIPSWLISKSLKEEATFLFAIDNMKYDLENDTFDISNSHLIFKDLENGRDKILAEPEEIQKIVKKLLTNC